ncbi:MAG: TIGR01777 family oxidoreductase [Bdellovibrionota bacterium]
MKILITGATGHVGNFVGRKLVELGHDVVVITRSKEKALSYLEFPAEVIEHDLVAHPLPEKKLQGIEAIVHLMGETVDGRWTDKKKEDILISRKKSSEHLVQNLPASLKVIVSASAQGIYGDQKAQLVTEKAKLGSDFLADVCKQWEAPFKNLNKSIRAVQLRIGLVLDPQSGVLRKMIPLFQRGMGGTLGTGKQYMSWIAIEDLADIIVETLVNTKYQGAINCSTTNPVTNSEWTKLLGKQLQALPSPPVPSFALRIALGEMATAVLGSVKMAPEILTANSFNFKYPSLKEYFAEALEPYKNGQYFYSVKQFVPRNIESVFTFFSEAANLETITPPFLNFHVSKVSTKNIQEGTLIDYKLSLKGIPMKWKTLIAEWNPPHSFVDTQLSGPYRVWHHTHRFEKLGNGTLLSDEVRYKVPLGFLGQMMASTFVQRDVEKIFKFRREVIHNIKF